MRLEQAQCCLGEIASHVAVVHPFLRGYQAYDFQSTLALRGYADRKPGLLRFDGER